ncbi:MAG: cholesterol-dependent cytolysin perfringolysin O, partial [Clostridium perfringens]|nr:cholesterol-dependent cytolysin perfringolysin O [Clostridium perfringens]
MIRFKKTKLIASIAMALCMFSQPVISFSKDITGNNQSIDSGISSLSYNRNEVLASNGDKIESFVPKEGKKTGNKFIVVERQKRSLTTSPVDISIIDSVNDRTYPGALQLADKAFVENRPTILMVKRKPININIDLPGLKGENSIKVDDPTYGKVSGAIDELVSKWNEKYSSTHTLPA